LFGRISSQPGFGLSPNFGLREKSSGQEPRLRKLRFGIAAGAGLVADAPNARAGLFDEPDAVEQIGDQGVAAALDNAKAIGETPT
jgi:hypothetical protein